MLKKNLTRETLTEKINRDIGFSKNISKSLIDDIFDEIISALINTNVVKISSFGTFKTINKKERIGRNPKTKEPKIYKSIHNEVRDKLAEIGLWLGFETYTEIKVADGSIVDTVWQATIGNMGRVIYVFEVQSRGSIDGLILNLLKSMNNPAVQGVVAVSDADQLEKIKKHANHMQVGDAK